MTNRKLKGPSHFCEWVVGTTIESALRPIPSPKPKPPKNRKREVVRVQVTTDDESEEDTVRITYPRTGRSIPPSPPDPEPEAEAEAESEPEPEPVPIVTEAKTVIKKVRFEDGPIKSALKQTVITTPVESSDETSESGTESESEPASDSNISAKQRNKRRRKRQRQKQKQKQIEADSESDWDSDPDPTCKCHRCVKGREILRRIGKKKSKEHTPPPSPETSESEEQEPPKRKPRSGKNRKKGVKKVKEPEPDSDASDSAKDTSESEPETPPPKKQKKANKKQKQGKQKGKKNQDPAPEHETSESEPDPLQKNKKQQQKANAKKGGKKAKKLEPEPEPEEANGETSESANGTEDEAEPEEEKSKQQNKGKQKNKNKQPDKANSQSKKNKKKQKAKKETNKEPEPPGEPEAEEQAAEATKEQDQGKSGKMTMKEKGQPKYKDGVKKGNYPEGLPGPHMRRPQLIEPIRAQVVQTERVIETPEDPAPNAYYDSEHNIMRVYHGPVYGNHQSNALYPERNGSHRPLPMGMPHPMQNPYYYGFNNPKEYPNYSHMSPYHQHYAGVPPPEAYPHVPITQTMPPPPWYGMAGPPGPFPAPVNYQEKTAPASSKDKASQNNNVGPPSLTGKDNPYLPKRNKSQFSAWGSQGARTASKEHSQPAGSVRAASNNWGGSNNNDQGNTWNDGAGDTQNGQSSWDAAGQDNNNSNNGNDKGGSGGGDDQNGVWGTSTNDNQAPIDWGNGDTQETTQNQEWGTGSNKSNETVRKAGDHWGNDTYPGASGDWDQPKDGVSSVGQGADNNVGVLAADDANGNGNESGNGNDNEPPVSTAGDGGADNVMPGTWVETPSLTVGPDWGDATAAQETNGAADHW
ncbi:hypothetical protein SNK05_011617 [Fusarium graminearum]